VQSHTTLWLFVTGSTHEMIRALSHVSFVDILCNYNSFRTTKLAMTMVTGQNAASIAASEGMKQIDLKPSYEWNWPIIRFLVLESCRDTCPQNPSPNNQVNIFQPLGCQTIVSSRDLFQKPFLAKSTVLSVRMSLQMNSAPSSSIAHPAKVGQFKVSTGMKAQPEDLAPVSI
jgi:hypothetical protein